MKIIIQLAILISVFIGTLFSLTRPKPERALNYFVFGPPQELQIPIRTEEPPVPVAPLTPPPASATPSTPVEGKPAKAVSPKPVVPPPPPVIQLPQPVPAEPGLNDQDFYNAYAKATIQIFCATSQQYFSASGIILNERGLVLTNAHVGEIIKKVGADNCVARHGNPASAFSELAVVFVADTSPKITDTEVPQHDFAFLKLANPRESFNFASVDLSVAPEGERLRTLGYPSEFLEGVSASENANLLFSSLIVGGVTNIDTNSSVDAYLFSGGISLQQGSSGTAIYSPSGKVLGIIFATTKNASTQDREGVALMTSAIDRELRAEAGMGLAEFIASH